ncbi:HTH-type transcriptional regulator ImmR [Lachnospiraceae bacterium]|nr:HTH-type transcriptional regulator ImmR [Lachnospiraceae bacterium]
MAFAEKLKALRLENNMTQEYVAQRMSLARSTIAGYETKNRQPSHEKLSAFASLFHVTIDYLLDDEEPTYITMDEARTLPDDTQNLLIRFRRLPIRSKKDLLKHLHHLEIQAGIDTEEEVSEEAVT